MMCSQAAATFSSFLVILDSGDLLETASCDVSPPSFSREELLCPIYSRMGLKFVRTANSYTLSSSQPRLSLFIFQGHSQLPLSANASSTFHGRRGSPWAKRRIGSCSSQYARSWACVVHIDCQSSSKSIVGFRCVHKMVVTMRNRPEKNFPSALSLSFVIWMLGPSNGGRPTAMQMRLERLS